MREYKFKAWDLAQKVWLSHEETLSLLMLQERVRRGIAIDKGGLLERYCIVQFTGLKDKNGVEIYEGDIIKVGIFALNDSAKFGHEPWVNLPEGIHKNDITTIKDVFEVKWVPLQLHNIGVLISSNPDVVGVEVIGNVHDNPELTPSVTAPESVTDLKQKNGAQSE